MRSAFILALLAGTVQAEVTLAPMARFMHYGDTNRLGAARPFAKDPTVIHYGGRYLMYYSVCPYSEALLPAGVSNVWNMAVAESTNLTDWVRLGELAAGWDGSAAPCVKIIRGQIHLFYQNYGNGKNSAMCHATSSDGVTFTDDPSNPVFSPKASWCNGRAIDAEVYPVGDRLMMLYASRNPNWATQLIGAASAPLASDYSRANWSLVSTNAPVIRPELGWEGKCIEAPSVLARGGKWYLFYAGNYNNAPQQIGVAVSTNGVDFTRLFQEPALTNGAKGTWNASESGHPGVFEDDDGRAYLFYQGNKTGGADWYLSVVRALFTVVTNGGFVADADFETGASDVTHLGSGSSLSWPLRVGLSEPFPLAADTPAFTNFPVLTVPTSLREVSPADFTNTTPADPYGITRMAVEVRADGATGTQTVSIVRTSPGVITQENDDGYNTSWGTAATWSDKKAARAGYAYLNVAKFLRSPAQTEAVFAGDSLTLAGTAGNSPAVLLLKSARARIPDLRMLGNSWIRSGDDPVRVLAGGLAINGTADAPCYFGADKSRTIRVDSELSGAGWCWVSSAGAAAAVRPVLCLTARNTAFTGYVALAPNRYEKTAYPGALSILDERNLGGNPPAFLADALLINGGALVVTNSFAIDDLNRGVTVSNATVDVAAGTTLALDTPVVFNGPLTKTGGGTLALGFDCTGTSNEIIVAGGFLKVAAADALDGLRVALAAGTALVVPRNPADARMAAYGVLSGRDDFLASDSGRVPFRIEWAGGVPAGSFEVPLCTVTPVQAMALEGNVAVESVAPKGFQVSVVSGAVEVDGASRVRFAARYAAAAGTRYLLH